MKTPSKFFFCPSGVGSVVRFATKILVPMILNLLTLVVRNCTPKKSTDHALAVTSPMRHTYYDREEVIILQLRLIQATAVNHATQ